MNTPTELQRVIFEGSDPGPHLLITGGVHGDEFEPIVAIRKLIEHFGSNSSCGMSKGLLTLVPIVNEAAYLRGSRTAEDELDLARVCPGDPNGSITERTAHALSELIQQADYYIDLHTGGTTASVWPMTGYSLHPEKKILEQQRAMANAFNLPVIWGTSPHLDGRSLSVARDAGIPAIYSEYHGSGTCDPQGIKDYYEGCLNVMASLNLIAKKQFISRVRHVVEDDRPNAGNMQSYNPSPMTGYFETMVQLGDRVQSGDLLGTVYNTIGSIAQPIYAEASGYILVLRTYPRVMQSDMVAVIVETD